MTVRKIFLKKYHLILSTFLLIAGAYTANAYVASSTNYRIQSDSLNVGGVRQTSTNYISEDTIGEVATGLSESALYKLKAGYQQMNEIYIAVSAPADVNMTPDIGGITGGTGDGQAIWTATTDNPAGYSMSIKASTTPALQSGSSNFADYTPTGATPDFAWSVLNTASEFGFTPEGSHIVQKFKDEGGVCNINTNDTTDACWYNASTTVENITQSATSNHPSGTDTTVKFRAQSGASHVQEEGTYTAKISVTVTAL